MSTRRYLMVAAMIALVVMPAVLYATGQAEEPDGPTTVTLWTWGGIEDNIQQINEYALVNPDLFEDVQIEYVSAGGNDSEVYQAFRLALAAGTDLPDMVSMNYLALAEFATAGVLADLSEYVEPFDSDLTQAGRALTQYNGQTVAVPKQAKSKLWFYRSDMFAEAGIDPDDIRTADDFLEAAEQFNATFPDSYIINLGPQPIHYWYFTALSAWEDSQVATRDGEYQLTSHPSFSTWLQFTNDLYDSGLTYRTDDFSADWNQGFIDDRIGSWLGASWGWQYPIARWSESPEPEKWAVALWPEFVREGAEAGGGIVVVPKDAPNVDAAARYLTEQFLTQEGSVSYFRSTGVVPVTVSGLDQLRQEAANPVKPAGMSDEAWATDVVNFWRETFPAMNAESFEYFQIYPYDPSASAELDILRQHTEDLLAGRHTTVQQALEAAQADMESQIGNPYEN